MKKKIRFLLSAVILFTAGIIMANNINVSNVTLTGQNTPEDYALVQFDLSWDNSWKDDINWDAAWVFVKYKIAGSDEWSHAVLNTTAGNHTIPSGYMCSVGLTGSSGIGTFIYRSGIGSGDNTLANVRLRWEYGVNGLADGTEVTVKVFAVEMVYVPQGAYYLGDADKDQARCFYEYGTTGPYQVTGEEALNIGPTNGYLWASSYIESSLLPAAFPKGYNAIYCMKYEISEGQWLDFFNTLTDAQKAAHDITGADLNGKNTDDVLYRNTISWTTGDATCTRPDRACGYMSWADHAAYSDWAGLRPMTDMEFEKACRGTQPVVDDEYAWGTASLTAASTISGVEDGTETITNSGANCVYNQVTFTGGDGGQGPLRCGIFARSSTTREQAGASYYGIMELSGNMFERTVTVASSPGRNFTGVQGDGVLNADGSANVTNWPGADAGGVNFKGGTAASTLISDLRVSDRLYAGDGYTNRSWDIGIRSVRTAP